MGWDGSPKKTVGNGGTVGGWKRRVVGSIFFFVCIYCDYYADSVNNLLCHSVNTSKFRCTLYYCYNNIYWI